MKRYLGCVAMALLMLLVWGAGAQTDTKKTTVAKKTGSSKTAPKKSAAKGTGAKSSAASKSPAKKGAAKKSAVTWRNRQLTPTPDRYREIQSALAAKGYMPAENANGAWNQNSIDALKHFQQDQKLEPSGKINSLSLIALGLGPKRDAAPLPPAPPKQ